MTMNGAEPIANGRNGCPMRARRFEHGFPRGRHALEVVRGDMALVRFTRRFLDSNDDTSRLHVDDHPGEVFRLQSHMVAALKIQRRASVRTYSVREAYAVAASRTLSSPLPGANRAGGEGAVHFFHDPRARSFRDGQCHGGESASVCGRRDAAALPLPPTRQRGPVSPAYCDVVRVPLDWRNPSAGTIAIRFEWIPARYPGATRTIVAQDGGPGFPSTGSGDAYVRLSAPSCAIGTC